jgi:hypothetical protein
MSKANLIFYSDGTVWQVARIDPITWDEYGNRTGGGAILEQVY